MPNIYMFAAGRAKTGAGSTANNYTVTTMDDTGKLILRANLAVLLLLHGIAKITGGVDPIMGMLQRSGLPGEMAYLAYVGEVVAPLLILVGVFTRLAALVVVVNMLFAIYLAHQNEIFSLTKNGGWALELQGFFLVTAVVVVLMGAGRYSLGGVRGKYN